MAAFADPIGEPAGRRRPRGRPAMKPTATAFAAALLTLMAKPFHGGPLLGHRLSVLNVRASAGTWRGTDEEEDQRQRTMARDVFARSAPGRVLPLCDRVHARPLHLARTCAANSAGLLARNLGQ